MVHFVVCVSMHLTDLIEAVHPGMTYCVDPLELQHAVPYFEGLTSVLNRHVMSQQI